MSDTPKRGRKRTNKQYFGPEEEEAVKDFLSLGTMVDDPETIDGVRWVGSSIDAHERNKIYREKLRAPLDKMIESIIRKYKLYSNEMIFEDLHSDTLSFLMVKFHKFKPEKNKKSYSYFGTICKHYLLGKLIKEDKKIKTQYSYEDISSEVEQREEMMYDPFGDDLNLGEFIQDIINSIEDEMGGEILSESETKVGNALKLILSEWEDLFVTMGNNKYNKNLILLYMRELTGLTTKEIRNGMKRYKVLYKLLKNQL